MQPRNIEWFRGRFSELKLPTQKGFLELNGVVRYGIEASVESYKDEEEDYATDDVVAHILITDEKGKLWKSSPFYLNIGLDNRTGPIYDKAPDFVNELFNKNEFLSGIFDYFDSRFVEPYLVGDRVLKVYFKDLFVKYSLAFMNQTEDLTKESSLWIKIYYESGRRVEGGIIPGETTWFYSIPFDKLVSFNFRKGFPKFSVTGENVTNQQASVKLIGF